MFGPNHITSNTVIQNADYIAIHFTRFTELYPFGNELKDDAVFLLNCPAISEKEAEKYMPPSVRRQPHDKHAKVYVIDATKIANASIIPGRINLIMQGAFFQLSDIMSVETATSSLKKSVIENYDHQGKDFVDSNLNAIDKAYQV